jgi:hypothetical protein
MKVMLVKIKGGDQGGASKERRWRSSAGMMCNLMVVVGLIK